MYNIRGNFSNQFHRRHLNPAAYVALLEQRKVNELKQRLEQQAAEKAAAEAKQKTQPFNTTLPAGARKRPLQETDLYNPNTPSSVTFLRQQQQQILDPMIEDTKKYLAMKRKKQAFEDFLLTKRLQKEKDKQERKILALQREFEKKQKNQQESIDAAMMAVTSSSSEKQPTSNNNKKGGDASSSDSKKSS
jgi:hypothetical protein